MYRVTVREKNHNTMAGYPQQQPKLPRAQRRLIVKVHRQVGILVRVLKIAEQGFSVSVPSSTAPSSYKTRII